MDLIPGKKLCAVFSLVCLIGLKSDLGAADGGVSSVRDLGRLAWTMLSVIEREHVSAPLRRDLISFTVPVLTNLKESPELFEATAKFVRCHTEEEFSDLLCELVDEDRLPHSQYEQRLSKLTEKLSSLLGPIRLVPKKDQNVEDQFRNNRYIGVGVTVNKPEPTSILEFNSIVPGGPADHSGLKSGTLVREIDGQDTTQISLTTCIDRIRGPVGTEVSLVVRGPDWNEDRTVVLKRGFVRFFSVHDQSDQMLLNDSDAAHIGWIKLNDITSSTVSELRDRDAKERQKRTRVMVLDFRGISRPGDLHQAKLVADSLIDGGTMWYASVRGQIPTAVVADRECLFRGMPLVVLIDGTHLSPDHCVIAAALQDSGRTTIVGTGPPFKGTYTKAIPLDDFPYVMFLDAIKLTRSRAERNWPLTPDHLLAGPEPMEVQYPVPLKVTNKQRSRVLKRWIGQSKGKSRSNDASEEPVSALDPENLKSSSKSHPLSFTRIVEEELDLQPFEYFVPQSVPIQTFEAAGLRIAKSLLKSLPPEAEQ